MRMLKEMKWKRKMKATAKTLAKVTGKAPEDQIAWLEMRQKKPQLYAEEDAAWSERIEAADKTRASDRISEKENGEEEAVFNG